LVNIGIPCLVAMPSMVEKTPDGPYRMTRKSN
jgi:hypothetical protein